MPPFPACLSALAPALILGACTSAVPAAAPDRQPASTGAVAAQPDPRAGLFARQDTNGDGLLTPDEFRGGPARFGLIDRDENGAITLTELLSYDAMNPAQ
ncbi:MAG: hypothetical protein AAGH87_06905 [Pseudomonadota bacterium]